MSKPVSPRSVFITGGGSGIGFGIAQEFLRAGYHVGLFSRSKARLDMARKTLQDLGCPGSVAVYSGDVRRRDQVLEAVNSFASQYPNLTAVVASAGTAARQPAALMTAETFQGVIETNLFGSFYLAQAAYPFLRLNGGGVVLFIGSLMGHVATKYTAPYAASKAAVLQLAKALAVEWAEDRIRINAISPGYVETAFTERALANPAFRQRVLSRIPMHCWVTPETVGKMCVFLAGDAAAVITGQTVAIDGGFLAGDPGLAVEDSSSDG